jgi:hypothetical protein
LVLRACDATQQPLRVVQPDLGRLRNDTEITSKFRLVAGDFEHKGTEEADKRFSVFSVSYCSFKIHAMLYSGVRSSEVFVVPFLSIADRLEETNDETIHPCC